LLRKPLNYNAERFRNTRRSVGGFTKSEIADSRREAASLLAAALRRDKIFLIAHSEYELSFEEEKRFRDFIERRARREPFQYIVGRQEFCGLDFAVTKDVLIPRPETEMIVEAAIEILQAKANSKFCEIGIGSGCIAVSILHSAKSARAIGGDISEKALAIARRNAETHRVLDASNCESPMCLKICPLKNSI
jgi:release factor glutamine methyltransferase